jgi:GAF domain-containing protein
MKEIFLGQLREIMGEGQSRGDILERVCAFIKEGLPCCDWVGFYFVDEDDGDVLVLGPFVGEPTEHTRIHFGDGICGAAAASGETVVVDDVSTEPNYLSCNPRVKSEIVIPLCKEGQLIGELDIDSHSLAAFGDEERELLEEACEMIVRVL